MIIFLFNLYLVVLFVLVKLKIVPFNLFWKISPAIWLAILTVGLFIPMGWGAPSGSALVLRQSVQIVPDVAGEVIDVPVQPNTPLKANDVLFRLDPTPFQAQVDGLTAQLKLADMRLGQMTTLAQRDAGRVFDVEQRQAEVDQLRAQLAAAQWNLDKTVVRAPADGYVTNVGLRKGARVGTLPLAPAMAFIDTSDTVIGTEIDQIYARYIAPGQPVEVTFKFLPGQVFSGKVQTVIQAVSSGQATVSGTAVAPRSLAPAPFIVRFALDDPSVAARLPAGSTGLAAIYTDHVQPSHVIRKVILRQAALLNYILPF
jgi:multidrug resistance efflux pump